MNGDTYDDVFDPDDIDFHNLLVSYGGGLQQPRKKSWISRLWNWSIAELGKAKAT